MNIPNAIPALKIPAIAAHELRNKERSNKLRVASDLKDFMDLL